MSDEGCDIYRAVDQVRALFTELALLLSTAESLLTTSGWHSTGTAPAAGGSISLDYPRRWVPEYVHRFVTHPRHSGLLGFVAVIVENLEKPDLLTEPLVSAGWVDFGDKVGDWWVETARWHLYHPARVDDGVTRTFRPPASWSAKVRDNVHGICTLGLPLVSITNVRAVEERIVRPFLASIPQT